jgi:hypothetical protein
MEQKKALKIVLLATVLLLVGYLVLRYLKKKDKLPDVIDNMGGLLGGGDNNTDTSGNPNTPTGGDVVVTINNPQDPVLRDICFFKSNPLPYKGGGVYSAPKVAERAGVNGDVVTFSGLASGNYWFIVGGIPEYGGWSGTIKFSNGSQVTFSGLNITKAVQVTIP